MFENFDPIGLLSKGAGALFGGLLGAVGNSGSGKANETTINKDPWAAAQPYMLKNLQNEADLQASYQKTPFNAQQQQGYSNLFGDIGNFRDSVAPGLMDFANRGMTTSYQRQQGGAPGSVGYGGGGGNVQSGSGPFSVARGAQAQNQMLDLNGAQNPYINGAIQPAGPKAQAAQAGGLLGGAPGGAPGGGDGGPQVDHNPNWTAMGDVEKAQYYADNQNMAEITKMLQLGWGLTDLGMVQGLLSPEAMEKARQIARGQAFGAPGASFGDVNFGRDTFAGLAPGDISQLGLSLGQFGEGANGINTSLGGMFSGGHGGASSSPNAGHGYGQGFGGNGWGGTTTGGI
jgi:hypothetical protein